MGKLKAKRIARKKSAINREKKLAETNALLKATHLEIISKTKLTSNNNGKT